MKQTPNCIDNEKWVGLACSFDDSRPVLTNYLEYEDGTMVATNTHTIHVLLAKDKRIEDYAHEYDKPTPVVYQYRTPNAKKFAVADADLKFPNWTRVIPSEHKRSFVVRSNALMHSLIPFKKYTEDCASRIQLSFHPEGGLVITARNADLPGELHARVAIDKVENCEDFEIAVNVEYLIDAIRLSSEADKHQSFREIKFEFTENCRPMLIRHVTNGVDNTTRIAVIMPMGLW